MNGDSSMLNYFRNLYRLHNETGTVLAILTARTEQAAREAYAADNKEAQTVARVVQLTHGYPCDMFRIYA